MHRLISVTVLLAVLVGAAASARAQSPTLQAARQRADALSSAGNLPEAEAWAKKALDLAQQELGAAGLGTAISLNTLAHVYATEGRAAQAEPLYRRAVSIYFQTFGTFGAGPNTSAAATAAASHAGLGDLYYREGRYAEAMNNLRAAASIYERQAGASATSGATESGRLRQAHELFVHYADAAQHASASPYIGSVGREQAFAAVQWAQASATAAAVAHMAVRFAAGNDRLAAMVRERQDIQNEMDALNQRLEHSAGLSPAQRDVAGYAADRQRAAALQKEADKADNELILAFPRYSELANPLPLHIADAQALLAPDEALLAYVVGQDETVGVAVTPQRYEAHVIARGAAPLAGAVKMLRAALEIDSPSALPPFPSGTAFALYRDIVAPFAGAFTDAKRLIVVTDGPLDSLPFAVLLTEPPAKETIAAPAELRSAPWLAKRYAVSVLPSISALQSLRKFASASRAPDPFIGFGDPLLDDHPKARQRGVMVASVYRGGSVDVAALRELPSLPETAAELAAEARLFKASSGSVLLREAATVTAVKRADLASRRIVAFATHGLVAGDMGNGEPGLVLTPPANPSPDDDGLLKASEIAQLRLNADLVILSACNTAAPDGTPGAEGFSGLSKAFLYAGARSLLVSQWSVESDSTVALMTGMAAHLEEKGVGRAEALRRAELALMDDKDHPQFAHPLFWAPFVVVGEGG